MTHPKRKRHGGRTLNAHLRNFVITCGAALFFAASLCAAGDRDHGAESDASGSSAANIAPNQSVSLDDGLHGAPHELKASGERVSGEAVTPPRLTGEEAPASRSPVGRRAFRRKFVTGGPRDPVKLSSNQTTPWYRRGFGALAMVLLLVGVVTWLFKRWVPVTRTSGGGVLRIVARASVSPKHSVALVYVGNRFVLIGVCGDRVSSLCEISDPDEVARLAARTGASVKRDAGGFDDLLLREESDYREAKEPAAEGRRPARGGGARTREPWKDLLRKLRALQT
jgi:flagellar biogenesis protein FliO